MGNIALKSLKYYTLTLFVLFAFCTFYNWTGGSDLRIAMHDAIPASVRISIAPCILILVFCFV